MILEKDVSKIVEEMENQDQIKLKLLSTYGSISLGATKMVGG